MPQLAGMMYTDQRNKILHDFVWPNVRDKVKRMAMINETETGGPGIHLHVSKDFRMNSIAHGNSF